MNSGTDVYLPADVAVDTYKLLRLLHLNEHPGPGGRRHATERALFEMWEQYTAPYRVLRVSEYGGERHPHFVILRVEGHGLEEEVWNLRGEHRELDALRLSVRLRNERLHAQRDALEQGDLDWSLRHTMTHVRALADGQQQAPSSALDD